MPFWVGDSGERKEPCTRWRPDPQREGTIFGVVRHTEKHCESLMRCTQQELNNGISATAAADCIAPDWPVSH